MTSKPHYEADPKAFKQVGMKKEIYPRGLSIIWGNDRRYWILPNNNDGSPAELVQVSWLEVTGSTTLEVRKKYEIGFCVEMKDDAFGWPGAPVYLMAKIGKKGKYKWEKVNLGDKKGKFHIPENRPEKLVLEVKPEDANDTTLYFGLYEVWSGKWKGGLKIHHAFVNEVNNTIV